VTGEFAQATAVERRDDGAYAAEIAPGWDILGNANGGYTLAIAARAMADAAGRPPLGITGHYLAPAKVGPCTVEVTVQRAGRRMATVSAVVRAGGTDLMAVLGTFGDQVESGPTLVTAAAPDLPPIEKCVRTVPPSFGSDFGDRIDVRARPEDAGFREGRPSGRAEVAGWFRFADDHPVDAFGLVQVADAFAPTVFNAPDVPVSWAPTLDLTVHIRGVPAPGPLRCRFRSAVIQGGLFEEDGEMWDSRGVLVAQSRQLALVPRA